MCLRFNCQINNRPTHISKRVCMLILIRRPTCTKITFLAAIIYKSSSGDEVPERDVTYIVLYDHLFTTVYHTPGSCCNPRLAATGRVNCVCDWLRDATGLGFATRPCTSGPEYFSKKAHVLLYI